jgi:hypothetical protein
MSRLYNTELSLFYQFVSVWVKPVVERVTELFFSFELETLVFIRK